ncbi:MAG TPA: glutathione S-transferase family protein [Steroidobacteraceae bacterium]
MSLTLYAHPFASYCWKALIALYENATPFRYRVVEDAAGWAELESLWPIRKFPVLRDGEATIIESSIIIEYLMRHYPGASRMIPVEEDAALMVRFMDRFFDNYVMSPMQTLVADRMRSPSERDAKGVDDARKMLDVAYGWLETRLTPQGWVSGGAFSLADCSAAPALFYADWVHPLDDRFAAVRAYRARVLARTSVARVVEEARPYRKFFPQGAPDRD